MNASEYIARAAVCRIMYTELFQQACAVLPPTVVGEQELEVSYTLRDAAAALDITISQATMDVRRLENWGWVEKRKGSWRFLGRRCGGVFHLLADTAALQVTGKPNLISKEILGITLVDPMATTNNIGGGGAGRATTEDMRRVRAVAERPENPE